MTSFALAFASNVDPRAQKDLLDRIRACCFRFGGSNQVRIDLCPAFASFDSANNFTPPLGAPLLRPDGW
ncbi:hypothetical protein ABIF64_001739 [Bradyrhizobium japonicum]